MNLHCPHKTKEKEKKKPKPTLNKVFYSIKPKTNKIKKKNKKYK